MWVIYDERYLTDPDSAAIMVAYDAGGFQLARDAMRDYAPLGGVLVRYEFGPDKTLINPVVIQKGKRVKGIPMGGNK